MDSRELPIAMWQGSDREELAMVALTRTWVLRHTILDIEHLLLMCPQL